MPSVPTWVWVALIGLAVVIYAYVNRPPKPVPGVTTNMPFWSRPSVTITAGYTGGAL